MASKANDGGRVPWRLIGWAIPIGLLMIPLINQWPWTLSDFIFAGAMFAIVGGLFELTARCSANWAYRGGVAAALATSFLLVWINGAVGMIGDEGNPANLMFFVVILMAIAGGIAARFQAAGMARAMIVAGTAQMLIAVIVLLWRIGATEPPGFPAVAILIVLSGLPWFVSAWLFRNAARASKSAMMSPE